ncbi:MAG: YfiR family protein [Gammaproteobacteria bacterium]
MAYATPPLDRYSVLSALTLNFARFTQWPETVFSKSMEGLNICLVGDNIVQQAFENVAGKNVANKRIEVINANRLRNLADCHILFISDLPKNLLTQVFLDINGKPVLTIGETAEFVESGGMVGMIDVEGKIKLYINLPVAKSAGLMISSNLLRLSKIFDGKAR